MHRGKRMQYRISVLTTTAAASVLVLSACSSGKISVGTNKTPYNT